MNVSIDTSEVRINSNDFKGTKKDLRNKKERNVERNSILFPRSTFIDVDHENSHRLLRIENSHSRFSLLFSFSSWSFLVSFLIPFFFR